VATAQRFQRVTDLHGTILMLRKAVLKAESEYLPESGKMGLTPPAARSARDARFLSHRGAGCQLNPRVGGNPLSGSAMELILQRFFLENSVN
jgi:hypothetical protein